MLKSIDLYKELLKTRAKALKEEELLTLVRSIFEEVDIQHEAINNRLINGSNKTKIVNNFDIDKLESSRIFHISQIRKICINYRLKFLNTNLFKGDYPLETISKIRQLEKEHQIELTNFKIAAPAVLFKLKKADDPLLFAPIGNDFYYFIDKWGNDVHFFRSVKYWFVRSFDNFMISLLLISVLLSIFASCFFFKTEASVGHIIIFFMFCFKGVVGMALFTGVSIGKNFSEYSWKSEYDKVM